MQLKEAQQQFIASWGAFASHWGINRTLAQVHALLLISANPISQDDIMLQLNISRGNTNMTVRELIDWGLVTRVLVQGERKEYFLAEKDMWKVATLILKERKKRELDPILRLMDQLQHVEGGKEAKQFIETIAAIRKMGAKADKLLDIIASANENWVMGKLLK